MESNIEIKIYKYIENDSDDYEKLYNIAEAKYKLIKSNNKSIIYHFNKGQHDSAKK